MVSNELIDALSATAEICNARWTDATKEAVVSMLAPYPESSVITALQRCCLELRSITVADIIARIDDGRPGPQEAWAMLPRSEEVSAVITSEMLEAYSVAYPLMADPIAARVAFLEKYTKLLGDARANRRPVEWVPSLGHDKVGREAALREAVDRGRITAPQAAALLPDGIAVPGRGLLMIGTDIMPETTDVAEKARELARQILKDASPSRQVMEILHQKQSSPRSQQEHEERVKSQLEELKKGGNDVPTEI